MDKQFGEPLNHQYLDESVSLYHKQNRFSFSHSIFYTGNTVLDINNVCLCECLPCALWVFVFFFKWLCVSTLILTMLLCWLHVCFPQAAVRGQKGEKGEPAVLEPVSYWLSLSWFTWAGVFELALWQKEKAFPAKLLPEAFPLLCCIQNNSFMIRTDQGAYLQLVSCTVPYLLKWVLSLFECLWPGYLICEHKRLKWSLQKDNTLIFLGIVRKYLYLRIITDKQNLD